MLGVDKNQMKKNSDVWKENAYYDMAENFMAVQWEDMVWPIIKDCTFGVTVDLACGHGRNTEYLLTLSDEIILVDICKENLDFCKDRFKAVKEKKIHYLKSKGGDIPVAEESVDLVYCFDAMVHFEPETVYLYLRAIEKALKSGGHAFLHHSNYVGRCNDDWRYNPHARNFMHWNLFENWSRRAGLNIVSSQVIDWVEVSTLDRLTLLRKP